MREKVFAVKVDGGVLHGHRGGDGPPALLLHGGPAVVDYTEDLAEELGGLFAIFRYTQRGAPPSLVAPPYSIGAHVADAVAVLDHFGLERAWAVGHSWGGHLALHLLVSHPDRLLGLVAVDALGAVRVFAEQDANFRRRLTAEQVVRLDEIEARRRSGEGREAELAERHRILWPHWFADPQRAPPPLLKGGSVDCSRATNASIMDHFERRTLERGLPQVPRLPALFVHGELDPLPLRSATETAALLAGAEVAVFADCGHFPWLERPGAVRRAVESWLA